MQCPNLSPCWRSRSYMSTRCRIWYATVVFLPQLVCTSTLYHNLYSLVTVILCGAETAKLIPEHLLTYKVFGEPGGPHYAHYDLVGGGMVCKAHHLCFFKHQLIFCASTPVFCAFFYCDLWLMALNILLLVHQLLSQFDFDWMTTQTFFFM